MIAVIIDVKNWFSMLVVIIIDVKSRFSKSFIITSITTNIKKWSNAQKIKIWMINLQKYNFRNKIYKIIKIK